MRTLDVGRGGARLGRPPRRRLRAPTFVFVLWDTTGRTVLYRGAFAPAGSAMYAVLPASSHTFTFTSTALELAERHMRIRVCVKGRVGGGLSE